MMWVQPVSHYDEIKRFYLKNKEKIFEPQRKCIEDVGIITFSKEIYLSNFSLLKRYKSNFLFFFKDKKWKSFSFAIEYHPKCLEIGLVSMKGNPRAHYKMLLWLNHYVENLPFWTRIQCMIYEGSKFYIKMLKKMSFIEEGKVIKYDNKYNYILMAKVR